MFGLFFFSGQGVGRNEYDSGLMMYWFDYWLLLTIVWLPFCLCSRNSVHEPNLFKFQISDFSYKREKNYSRYSLYISLFPTTLMIFFFFQETYGHSLESIGLDSEFNFVKLLSSKFYFVDLFQNSKKLYVWCINGGNKNVLSPYFLILGGTAR